MARYAILSDIHANSVALEAVLHHAETLQPRVEEFWCLGDLVVYGPLPVESLELAQNNFWKTCVMGNNDYAVVNDLSADSTLTQLSGIPGMEGRIENVDEISLRRATIMTLHNWTCTELMKRGQGLLENMKHLPEQLTRENAQLLHASPCDPVGMDGNYIHDIGDAEEAFLDFPAGRQLCFFGHTHFPTIFYQESKDRSYANVERINPHHKERIDLNTLKADRFLVNPGSVGQPRDKDNRASYAVYDTNGSIEFHRVDYDFQRVLKAIEANEMDLKNMLAESDRRFQDQIVETLKKRISSADW
jgi:predicted phosphodiesterase